MRTLVIFLALAAAVPADGSAAHSFDNIDLNQFQTDEQIANLIKCGADNTLVEGCSQDVINMRERATEFIGSNCASCTPNEKQAVAYLILKVVTSENGLNTVITLLRKYDKNGGHIKSLLEAVNKFETKLKVPKIPESIMKQLAELVGLTLPDPLTDF